MNVTLLTSHDAFADMVRFAVTAALTCHDNTDKDVDPKELLLRIIKLGHESVLEHINLTYSIKGISRAVLQQLARHRHISLSVESTRHTVKVKIASEPTEHLIFASRFAPELIFSDDNTGIERVYRQIVFDMLKQFIFQCPEVSNDQLKYLIPELWPTNLILTSNIRELRHILKLRTHPSALMEFRKLGIELFSRVPDDFKYLLEDCVYIGG